MRILPTLIYPYYNSGLREITTELVRGPNGPTVSWTSLKIPVIP